MTFTAFFLILISAFLHAGWNFLSKKQVPSLAFYSLSTSTATLLALCGVLLAGRPCVSALPARFWPIWVASVACEVIYCYGLARAYRRDDISFVYPLARALPVLLTALLTLMLGIGTPPGGMALAGMGVLSFGCILMPLKSLRGFRIGGFRSPALKFVLIAAAGTTGYTILDSKAIHLIRAAGMPNLSGSIFYLFLIESGIAVSLFTLTALHPAERAEFRKLFLKTVVPAVSGTFSFFCYVLVLMAMSFVNNVSYIQAFRQMSLPLGVFAGIFLLHERPGAPRLTGISLVVAGLVIIAFGS